MVDRMIEQAYQDWLAEEAYEEWRARRAAITQKERNTEDELAEDLPF